MTKEFKIPDLTGKFVREEKFDGQTPEPKNKFILVEGEIIPATLTEWAQWFETPARMIKSDEFEDIKISTVFLGDGTIFYETMIFGGAFSDEQIRTRTRSESLKAHARLLAMSGIIELKKLHEHGVDKFNKEIKDL